MASQKFLSLLDTSNAVEASIEQVVRSGQVPQIVIHYHSYVHYPKCPPAANERFSDLPDAPCSDLLDTLHSSQTFNYKLIVSLPGTGSSWEKISRPGPHVAPQNHPGEQKTTTIINDAPSRLSNDTTSIYSMTSYRQTPSGLATPEPISCWQHPRKTMTSEEKAAHDLFLQSGPGDATRTILSSFLGELAVPVSHFSNLSQMATPPPTTLRPQTSAFQSARPLFPRKPSEISTSATTRSRTSSRTSSVDLSSTQPQSPFKPLRLVERLNSPQQSTVSHDEQPKLSNIAISRHNTAPVLPSPVQSPDPSTQSFPASRCPTCQGSIPAQYRLRSEEKETPRITETLIKADKDVSRPSSPTPNRRVSFCTKLPTLIPTISPRRTSPKEPFSGNHNGRTGSQKDLVNQSGPRTRPRPQNEVVAPEQASLYESRSAHTKLSESKPTPYPSPSSSPGLPPRQDETPLEPCELDSDTEKMWNYWIPSHLSETRKQQLRSEIEKGPSSSPQQGYVYAYELIDRRTNDFRCIKVGSAMGSLARAEWWRRLYSRKDIILLGVWPQSNVLGQLVPGYSEPVVKSRDCAALEALVRLELRDLAEHSGHAKKEALCREGCARKPNHKCKKCKMLPKSPGEYRDIFSIQRHKEKDGKDEVDLIKQVFQRWACYVDKLL